MRKRPVLAGLGLAGLFVLLIAGGSEPVSTVATPSSARAAMARFNPRLGASGRATDVAPMPVEDARIDAFLAEQTLAGEIREKLVDLAREQRVTYAPRLPGEHETAEARAARRTRREQFRAHVRDVVAAMPDETRAAMRRHKINLVRLAQAIEAKSGAGAP